MNKKQKEYLYENGKIAKGNVLKNFRWVFLHSPLIIINVKYSFILNKKIYCDIAQIFTLLNPKSLFWKKGQELDIIYDPNNPAFSTIYDERLNKKYKK